MSYSLDEHHHRFATWAAARAAQRGLGGGTLALLQQAIEVCGVVDAVETDSSDWTAASYDEAHAEWCRAVVDELERAGVERATFGRAAKLIAIYVKSRVILAGGHESALGCVAHPPIDEIVLKALAADPRFDAEHRRLWRAIRWTQLDEGGYRTIIESFRAERLHEPAFWMVERYWAPDRTSKKTPPPCPSCGSNKVVPILFGYPTEEAFEEAARGEIVLGGCCIMGDGSDPKWQCLQCDDAFG
jgi:hypothetical protein